MSLHSGHHYWELHHQSSSAGIGHGSSLAQRATGVVHTFSQCCDHTSTPPTLPNPVHTRRRHSEASTKALAQFTQLFGDVGEGKPEGKGKGGGKGSGKEEEKVCVWVSMAGGRVVRRCPHQQASELHPCDRRLGRTAN